MKLFVPYENNFIKFTKKNNQRAEKKYIIVDVKFSQARSNMLSYFHIDN